MRLPVRGVAVGAVLVHCIKDEVGIDRDISPATRLRENVLSRLSVSTGSGRGRYGLGQVRNGTSELEVCRRLLSTTVHFLWSRTLHYLPNE